jgi:hypothetical protein
MTMPDLLDVAETLHREAHADGAAAPRLGNCPFHDPDMITYRAKLLLPWYQDDPER